MVFTVAQVTSTFSVLYGLIVVQVISAFLFLWFDCYAFDKRVPWFYGLIVAQVTSAFWFLWFDCGLSHKRVLDLWFDCDASYKRILGFMV